MKLTLARDLALPAEAATQTFLVVGKRGSGKSTTCVRLAEQLIKAHVPVVVVDPVDRWWGLKASRDGTGPGLSVYVFGGERADLPLEPGSGTVIADTIVEHRLSAVLSVKHLSGGERGRFVSDLASRLFQRNKEPLHVFLEEAHEVAPQQPFKGDEEMLGRVTRLWKLGRSSGLGGSAITQRPASLSKNITTQAEILIVHRTIGPQDVAAVREWIRYHGEHEGILGELATLKTGEAFVWAPDFPEGKPIGLKRVQILDRETFDSSATPKVGERAVEPKALAPVDLERLRVRMAATIEKAKAEDPRELRRQLSEVRAELAKERAGKNAIRMAKEPPQKRVEVSVFKDAHLKSLERAISKIEALRGKLSDAVTTLSRETFSLQDIKASQERLQERLTRPPFVGNPQQRVVNSQQRVGNSPSTPADLPKGEMLCLAAIAQHQGGVTRPQLTVLTGYKTSTRNAYIQRLNERQLLNFSGERVLANERGIAALGQDYEPLPVGKELQQHWLRRLPEGEAKILDLLIVNYPKSVYREFIGQHTGYKTSTRNAYIQRLTTRELVEAERGGTVRAAEHLF